MVNQGTIVGLNVLFLTPVTQKVMPNWVFLDISCDASLLVLRLEGDCIPSDVLGRKAFPSWSTPMVICTANAEAHKR